MVVALLTVSSIAPNVIDSYAEMFTYLSMVVMFKTLKIFIDFNA